VRGLIAGVLFGLGVTFFVLPIVASWMRRNGLFSTGAVVHADPERSRIARENSERGLDRQIVVLRRLAPLGELFIAAAVVLLVAPLGAG
jgi:hypothetical protein